MPEKRSLLRLILCAIAVAVCLAGCMRRTDVGEGGRKITRISIAFWGGQNEVILVDKIVSKFERLNPDIRVNRVHITGDYNAKLQTMMAANRGPDVFYVMSGDCFDYLSRGALRDLAPYINKSKVVHYDDYFIETVRQFKQGKHIYALSWDWSPCVVFYNKTFFDQAGVPYPKNDWTWSDFLETAKKLTVRDKRGRVLRYGTLQVPGWVWWQWVLQNGGTNFNAGLDRCMLDSPAAIQGQQFEYDLTAKYHVSPPPGDPEADNAVYFMSGKAAMVFSYRWFITFLEGLKRYDWGIAPSPRGKIRATMSGAVGFAMSAKCKHPKEAWRLIEYLCGPVGQAGYVDALWGVPTLTKLAAEVDRFEDPAHPNYDYRLFADETKYAKVALASPYIPDQQFYLLCKRERDKLFLGEQSVRQTLENITRQTNAIIAENKRLKAAGRK